MTGFKIVSISRDTAEIRYGSIMFSLNLRLNTDTGWLEITKNSSIWIDAADWRTLLGMVKRRYIVEFVS